MAASGPHQWSVRGKVIIVTGANTGIGKITAIELAKKGPAKVILACRNQERAHAAAGEIRKSCGLSQDDAKVVVRHLDLTSLASVRKFAAQIIEEEPELHLLVNNAGVNPPNDKVKTEDGFELAFQTNYLGQFLLTTLLLDLLKKSAPSRVVCVNSDGYLLTWPNGLHIDDMQFERRKYDSWTAYCESKVAFLLYCWKLAKILKDEQSNVTVLSLHPGMVLTDIIRHRTKFTRFVVEKILYPSHLLISPEDGAKTTIYCSCQPGLEKDSGCYFSNSKKKSLWSMAVDKEKAEKLWQMSHHYCQLDN